LAWRCDRGGRVTELGGQPGAHGTVKYRTIVADPAWPVDWHGGGRGRHFTRPTLGYPVMDLVDIARLPVADIAEANAALFLWVTASLNRRGIGVQVAHAWGFEPVGEFIWDKGMRIAGAFPRICHEVVLVCRRGDHAFTPPTWVSSVQRWPVSKQGSAKPEAFIDLVEQVSPGPYVELFARRHRLGWAVWGNESANTAELGPVA